MLSTFKCYECREFLHSNLQRAYTYGECAHYFCSGCADEQFDAVGQCPAKDCSTRGQRIDKPRIEHNLSKAFAQAYPKFETPTCETHDQQIEFFCYDPNCTVSVGFECIGCSALIHENCPKKFLINISGLLKLIKIKVGRYKCLVKDIMTKLKEKQLVCPKMDEISDEIEKRITRLCNIEGQFFCPSGFKSEYELTNAGQDIEVHDKVLKQVEPLVVDLLKDWETKSLETISAGLEKIGTVCKVKDLVVNREVKPHIVAGLQTLPVLCMDDERQQSRHVDLA
jgi:hypothetical protein